MDSSNLDPHLVHSSVDLRESDPKRQTASRSDRFRTATRVHNTQTDRQTHRPRYVQHLQNRPHFMHYEQAVRPNETTI